MTENIQNVFAIKEGQLHIIFVRTPEESTLAFGGNQILGISNTIFVKVSIFDCGSRTILSTVHVLRNAKNDLDIVCFWDLDIGNAVIDYITRPGFGDAESDMTDFYVLHRFVFRGCNSLTNKPHDLAILIFSSKEERIGFIHRNCTMQNSIKKFAVVSASVRHFHFSHTGHQAI